VTAASAEPAAEATTPHATGRPRRIVHLVHNRFTHDMRVLSEARSAAARGDVVTVIAVVDRDLPDRETVDGVAVARFPTDPPDTRLWRNRSRITRPWRFRREAAAWFGDRVRAGGSGVLRAAIGAVVAVLLLPWVLVTMAYHYGIRSIDRLVRGRIGATAPSAVVGGWIERRSRAVVFSAHRALRLDDWGRRIEAAVAAGDVELADLWHAADLETLPIALRLRGRFGGRVVFDSHELYLEAAGRARMRGVRRWLVARGERRWGRAADAVVTVNDGIAAELERRLGITRPVVVRNCRPRWAPRPGFVSPLRAAMAAAGVEDAGSRPVVLVHGGFQVERGFEETLDALREEADIAVAFLGYGALEERYRTIAAGAPWAGRLAVLGAVAPDDVVPWVAGADVAACLIQPTTLNHRLSTPNKLFEAIAAGVPLVAADFPAIAPIVRRWDLGRLVDPTRTSEIRAAIRAIVDLPAADRERLRANARRAADEELNWDHEFAALAAVYDSLVPPTDASVAP
jgi:glycosyltransferase involved in cell wall biosynthesis